MLEAFANNVFETIAKIRSYTIVLLGGGTTLIGDPSGKEKVEKF